MAEILEISAADSIGDLRIRDAALQTLEAGGVVHLPGLCFRLLGEEREPLLHASAMLRRQRDRSSQNGRPTILFYPDSGRISRGILAPRVEESVRSMMKRFSAWSEDLLATLLPDYAQGIERDRTTFRPCERSKPQGLHIDSSPGHPTQGRAMLRIFSNVDPGGRPRVWQLGEGFDAFVERFLPRVGRSGIRGWLAARAGVSRGRRTGYDALVEKLRLAAKRDLYYQETAPRQLVEFSAGSTWIALTDLVVHGAMSGRHSLDRTFFLSPDAMRRPEASSLRTLERLTGRTLA